MSLEISHGHRQKSPECRLLAVATSNQVITKPAVGEDAFILRRLTSYPYCLPTFPLQCGAGAGAGEHENRKDYNLSGLKNSAHKISGLSDLKNQIFEKKSKSNTNKR
jgi:hypothetical protein